MKSPTNSNLIIRSSAALVLALALSIWSPAPARSAEPAEGKHMTDAKMMECCKEMKEQKQKMMEDVKAQDAELNKQITKMNSAPENKKLDLMAAALTLMADQRSAMNARKAKMQEDMMKHMSQHMQMGKDSMSQCSMMSDKPVEGKHMTDAKMMERCKEIKEQKQKMMEDMKAQNAELNKQITKMNSAPENKKLDLMAAALTLMADQRSAMNARKAKMQEDMMKHMSQHMQMGKDSMSECSMMKDMDEKSESAQEERK